jgi:putative addiction module killer protein
MYTVIEDPEFTQWLGALRDRVTRIRLSRRLDKARAGNLGDVKPVGEGVFEMREFFGPGWRMYYIEKAGAIIVMLGGGDKSTQDADIQAAIALSKEYDDAGKKQNEPDTSV